MADEPTYPVECAFCQTQCDMRKMVSGRGWAWQRFRTAVPRDERYIARRKPRVYWRLEVPKHLVIRVVNALSMLPPHPAFLAMDYELHCREVRELAQL